MESAGRLVIGRSRAALTVEVAYSLPKLEAARVLFQREGPRCGEGLWVGIGVKVSQRENPRFSNLRLSTEEVALISEHSAIRLSIQAGARGILSIPLSLSRQRPRAEADDS
jgi:hypothetical protein